jgi:predicted RNA-binding protein YlxR (DUF448 family)/ribosomal protein L7Ae-like RNA K-turn-binding protein
MNAMTTHDEPRAKAATKRAERTCAGCSQAAPAEELVRVVFDPNSGGVAVDLAGSGFGRGAHVHPTPACVAKAVKGGLSRVYKAPVVADAAAMGVAIMSVADRRIAGLLHGARRAGQLAVGADVVAEAIRDGRVSLVVVARDAAAATKVTEIAQAIGSGRAIAWGDKQELGAISNREGVAVLAILHPGVAAAVAQTHRVSGPFRVSLGGSAGKAGAQPEDEDSEEAWSSLPEVR